MRVALLARVSEIALPEALRDPNPFHEQAVADATSVGDNLSRANLHLLMFNLGLWLVDILLPVAQAVSTPGQDSGQGSPCITCKPALVSQPDLLDWPLAALVVLSFMVLELLLLIVRFSRTLSAFRDRCVPYVHRTGIQKLFVHHTGFSYVSVGFVFTEAVVV